MCQYKSSWWIPGERIFDNLREINIKIDYFPVKLCNTCNKVWEMPLKFTRHTKIIYHKDFPTYGLEREECYACINQKRRNNCKSK